MATMQAENYYCHRCEREVHLNQDGKCTTCNEGFIEKMDTLDNDHEINIFQIGSDQSSHSDFSEAALFNDSRHTINNIIQSIFGGLDHIHPLDFRSSPSDYIFSEESFDNIVTRIMNQFEQTGPPPANSNDIQKLKSKIIENDGGSCTICLEDFLKDQEVKELPCQHEYHAHCIKVWLTKHGTCPVCRKDLSGNDTRLQSESRINGSTENNVHQTQSNNP